MSEYRRYFIPGGTYFFTVVTERRVPLFWDETARALLANAMRVCRQRSPFESIAMVLLPDHLHALWTLPPGDDHYSSRWQRIKRLFASDWLTNEGREQRRGPARQRERRRGVWQRRFWEHLIHDEADLEAHFDYIHYNPVKHGYVESPHDWPWSTFHKYLASAHYPANWAKAPAIDLPGDAGE